MKIEVSLVVFSHETTAVLGKYCSYCPAIREFQGRGNTINEVTTIVERILKLRIERRLLCANLTKYGWIIKDDKAIPPIFTDEELVQMTESHYEVKLEHYKILRVNVEV